MAKNVFCEVTAVRVNICAKRKESPATRSWDIVFTKMVRADNPETLCLQPQLSQARGHKDAKKIRFFTLHNLT